MSGSIIPTPAGWRLVFEFSARKVGPKVQTLVNVRQEASMFSWAETVRNPSRPQKSRAKSTLPSGIRVRLARSRVETRKSAPAPSASEDVTPSSLGDRRAAAQSTTMPLALSLTNAESTM